MPFRKWKFFFGLTFFFAPGSEHKPKKPAKLCSFFPRALSKTQNKRPALVTGFSSLSIRSQKEPRKKNKKEMSALYVSKKIVYTGRGPLDGHKSRRSFALGLVLKWNTKTEISISRSKKLLFFYI